MAATLLVLAGLFGGLSLLAFGGGNAVTAAIERAAVSQHHWMTAPQFLALFALARSAPGPGSLIAALVGQKAAGLSGALVAMGAMYLPSTVLIAALARAWRRFEQKAWRYRLETALIPVAVGLTVGSGLVIASHNQPDLLACAIIAAATAVLTFSKANPLIVLAASGVIGWAVF